MTQNFCGCLCTLTKIPWGAWQPVWCPMSIGEAPENYFLNVNASVAFIIITEPLHYLWHPLRVYHSPQQLLITIYFHDVIVTQVGFHPTEQSHASYEARGLPPSHQSWIHKTNSVILQGPILSYCLVNLTSINWTRRSSPVLQI